MSRKQLLGYAVLALPLAFAGLPIYMLAPDFYATSYQMPLTVLGLGLLGLRILDAFLDPLLGYLIDDGRLRFQTLMRAGAACMALGLLMLFWVPVQTPVTLAFWFALSIFITTLAYSLLTIGYGVQGALWSGDGEEQVRITSTREGFTLIGLILAISLPWLLMHYLPPVETHRLLALILVAVLALSYAIYAGVNTPRVDQRQRETRLRSLWQPRLRQLYAIYGMSVLASAIPAVLVIFFVRDYLQTPGLIGGFLLLYFLAGACSMPVWRKLASRLGKMRAWQLSMLLAIVGFILVIFIEPGQVLFFALICLATGLALGAELALPPALLAEMIEQNACGLGVKYAGLTGLNKLSLALAAGLSMPLLGLLGFVPGQANDPIALSALLWLYGGLPCLLKLLALLLSRPWKPCLQETNPCPQNTF